MNQDNLRSEKKLFIKIIIPLMLTVFLLSVFVNYGCKKSEKTNNTSEAASLQTSTTVFSKFLNVGIDATFPPFAYLQGEEIVGFDVDLAGEIAKRLEKELKITQMSYNEIYEKINEPEIDIIISAIIPNQEKSKTVDFSDPYYTLEYTLITLTTSKLAIGNDFISKKIGIIKSEIENLDPEFLLNYSVGKYDDAVALIKALKSQEVDGILISAPIDIRILRDDPDSYKFIEKIKSEASYSIIIKKGTGLTERINEILKEINADGTFQEIYNEWLRE